MGNEEIFSSVSSVTETQWRQKADVLGTPYLGSKVF